MKSNHGSIIFAMMLPSFYEQSANYPCCYLSVKNENNIPAAIYAYNNARFLPKGF
jgi:hypothetical protein